MSGREPMWFCHECHAEMRPLMVPDPHCASCNGTFVEKLDNPADDPREFDHVHDGFEDDALPQNINGMLAGLRTILQGGMSNAQTGDGSGPASQRSQSEGPRASSNGSSTGGGPFTIRIDRRPGYQTTTIIGGRPGAGGPSYAEFVSGGPSRQGGGDAINGALMAQYLLAMLANRPGQRNPGSVNDLFGGLFGTPEGAENGRWGDYVFNQEALDQIITQIMENSNANAPVPATEEIMKNLPREILEEGSPLLEKDCAVCKEQFQLGTEDPDEQIIVTLPCKHPFHEPCIMPWLKSSGTCPVCRYQLIPQPEHQAPGSRPPGGPSSNNGSGSGNGFNSSRSRSPGASQSNPSSPNHSGPHHHGGFLSHLFSLASGSHSHHHESNDGDHSQAGSSSNRTHDGHRRSSSSDGDHGGNIPGGWADQLD
ncbi:uncharacterized protein LAESUDRAFT_723587 [Laetiporus sulphureus 93-53]|uniref:RING-type domain-containing protein n=1 Tax=Laetiporus sulphureus 93-53 TaxID=1314785 RepID=A0A165FAM4_9APHY|nr:uncharacterized protein LAESUDRAFT_723587 [Laetiporus sulphureus 93-53]KZT08680.1 hypothetical protein LAESUDRAFT_723587 [Laetiporus sulphureus 93-53]